MQVVGVMVARLWEQSRFSVTQGRPVERPEVELQRAPST